MEKHLTQQDIDQNPILSGLVPGSVMTITGPENQNNSDGLPGDDADPIPTDPTKPKPPTGN